MRIQSQSSEQTLITPKVAFDKKYLIALVFPLIVEQILSVMVGMADMIMVSGAGETAVSGVSLVNTIANLLIYVFSALASGGAVVAAQALGAKKKDMAEKVSNQLILVCLISGVAIAAFSLAMNKFILNLIYGNVEQAVMDNAIIYFYITAFSFPFLAVYFGSTALFRSMGNTKLSMYVSAAMNILNIIGNAVFVFGFHMGIAGVGYATLFSRAFACLVVILVLRNQKYELHIDRWFRFGFSWDVIKKILKIGIPSGVDNAMFQIGKLFTQSLISSFGTASIAANATASTIELLATIPASAMGLALTTVVGQCVGAQDFDGVKIYAKRLMKWAYIMLWIENLFIILLTPQIAGWYHLSAEGDKIARLLIYYHSITCMIMWPAAWTLPAILRASGDVKFVMWSSMASMWICRIVLAYLIGGFLRFGVFGVWIAMTIDWFARCILNIVRLKSGRWMRKAVV